MKKFLLMCFSFGFAISVWAQDRVVTGKVASEDGSPLPGVNVIIKGTTFGTTTDANGNYSLNVPAGANTISFSFIGYKSVDVEIGSKSAVDVVLSSDITQLNEVVVTSIGIAKESRNIGYAVATVKSDLLTQTNVTNPFAALSAKVSGLQINQTDNGINGGVRVVLRGNRSLLGNNQALVVLDGTQVPSDVLTTLNQNDIESISVMKGASASALYGSQASNGVLIVTTKKGTSKAPVVTLNSTTQLDVISYYPRLQTRFGGYGGEGPGPDVYNIDPNWPGGYVAYENQSYGPAYNGAIVPYGRPIYVNGVAKYQYGTYSARLRDHLNFFNTGATQQTGASVAGGSENSTFYFSFQDVNKSGVLPHDQYRRDNVRFNGSQAYGNFKVGYQVSYTLTHQDINYSPGFSAFGQVGGLVYWDWFNTQLNVPLTQYKNWQTNQFATNTGYYNDFYNNPYFDIDANRRQQNQQDFLGNLDFSFKPLKWLEFIGKANLSNTTSTFHDYLLPNIYDPATANPNKYAVQQGNTPPAVTDSWVSRRQITTFFMAAISHNFTPDLGVKLLLGNNLQNFTQTNASVGAGTLLYLDPVIYNPTYRSGTLTGGTYYQKQNLVGDFADLTLTYKYLTVHGSVRNDINSLLAANNRSFSYPEADVAFVFTEALPSLQNNKFLSYGKLTGSIAKTGNVSLTPYQIQTVFNAYTPYNGALGSVPVNYHGLNAVAPSIKPEFTTQNEVGLELGLLENKIKFNAVYYSAKTTNQTVPFNVSRTTGYSSALINTGEVDNNGIELDLTYKVLNTSSGFSWTITPNLTHISNTVKSIYTSPSGDVFNSIQLTNNVGGTVYSYGIVGKQYPQIQVNDWNRDPQGRVIVDPVTGLPSRNPNLTTVGSGNPTLRMGIGNTFTYKGLSLNVLVDYRAGGYIFNQLGQGIEFGGLGYVSAEAGRQRFVYPNSSYQSGSDANGKPVYTANTNITVNDGNYNFWQNLYNNVGMNYVTKSDFVKLREVALSYNIPASIVSKSRYIKSAKISLTGRNLLMWRPKSNQWTDPEYSVDTSNANGVTSLGQTPPTRTYGLQFLLTF